MADKYAYFCNRRECDNCTFPTCKHTTNKENRLYEEGTNLKEMRFMHSVNGVNYYMEFIRNSMDYLRDM